MTTLSVPDGRALLPDGLEITESRLRLLTVAVQLFGDRGYPGVSMRDLAEGLGIKSASLYAHVPSKQHLLFEVMRIGLVEHAQVLRLALLEAPSDPAEQVRALVRAHVLMALQRPSLTRVITHELKHLEEPFLGDVQLLRDQPAQYFLEVVDRGCRLGTFDVVNPRLSLRAIADMGFRLAEWPRPAGSDEEIVDSYQRFALRLLTS